MRIVLRAQPERRNYIFCAIAIVLCLRHALLVFGVFSLAGTLFGGLYVLVGLFMAVGIFKKMLLRQTAMSRAVFWTGFLFLIWTLGIIYFRYRTRFEDALTFFLVFPLLLCLDMSAVKPADGRLFFWLMTILGALLSVMAFQPSGYRDGVLLLYTLNGNQSGLLYMSVFLCVFLFWSLNNRNPVLFPVLAGLFYGCLRTESRTSVIGCVLIVVLTLLLHKGRGIRRNAVIVITCMFIVLPFLASLLVTWLGADFQIMGTSAWTGREDIWPTVLEKLAQEPFSIKIDRVLRDHYGEDLGAHNVWLSIAWNFGVPMAVAFIISLFYTGRKIIGDLQEKETGVLIASFAAGLLHMTFESSLIVGALDYSLYFLLALLAGSALKKELADSMKEEYYDKPAANQHYRTGL